MSGITSPAEPYFKDGIWGWDGTVWRKLSQLWGYSDQYAEVAEETVSADGNVSLYLSTVPAGEIWVVEFVTFRNRDTAIPEIQGYLDGTSADIRFYHNLNVVAGTYYTWAGTVRMKEGDRIAGFFGGCVTNDVVRLQAMGYKMKIAE